MCLLEKLGLIFLVRLDGTKLCASGLVKLTPEDVIPQRSKLSDFRCRREGHSYAALYRVCLSSLHVINKMVPNKRYEGNHICLIPLFSDF